MTDDKLPWDHGDVVITTDNVYASQRRHEAIKAMKEGRATAEQQQLLADCDRVMQEALKARR
jgi:hypothetical protein